MIDLKYTGHPLFLVSSRSISERSFACDYSALAEDGESCKAYLGSCHTSRQRWLTVEELVSLSPCKHTGHLPVLVSDL